MSSLAKVAPALLIALAVAQPALVQEPHKLAPPRPTVSLWHGGTILTMDGPAPHMVQAVVERGGTIVFTGSLAKARQIAGKNAADHDLKGMTMLPGFVDSHSHFAMEMLMANGVDLGDPAHPVNDIPSLLGMLKAGIATRNIQPGGWVVAWQYDDRQLAEHRHITRTELDTLGDYKIVLVHFTGHGMVANSAAMAEAGITETTPNPTGGITLRDAAGKLTGVFFENAALPIQMKLPRLNPEERLAALDAAQFKYARKGYTHMQDGASYMPDINFLTSPEAITRLKLDLAMLPTSQNIDAMLKRPDLQFGVYRGHVKLEGIKFVLDGSPQARTAFMTHDYALGALDGHKPWHGTPSKTQENFNADVKRVLEKGWQLFVHANGDAAIDMVIKGFDAAGIKAKDDARPVVIHSQFQRLNQLKDYARIGVAPAYFSNHTYYFADIHRSNFPKEVVATISPLRSALKAGLHASNHSDAPVTPLDPFFQLWSSMTRQSLTGVINGPKERISAYQGLQMLTTGPAWQVFEENRKGRIRIGLLADFVVLDHNPLTTPVDQIRSIKVLETVKEGQVVWKRAE